MPPIQLRSGKRVRWSDEQPAEQLPKQPSWSDVADDEESDEKSDEESVSLEDEDEDEKLRRELRRKVPRGIGLPEPLRFINNEAEEAEEGEEESEASTEILSSSSSSSTSPLGAASPVSQEEGLEEAIDRTRERGRILGSGATFPVPISDDEADDDDDDDVEIVRVVSAHDVVKSVAVDETGGNE